jgi:hypothetical protein
MIQAPGVSGCGQTRTRSLGMIRQLFDLCATSAVFTVNNNIFTAFTVISYFIQNFIESCKSTKQMEVNILDIC